VLQDDTQEPSRTDKTPNMDDVFHNEDIDEADTSEQTRLLPSATVSAAEPSVPRPLTSSPVIQNPSRTYKSDSEKHDELVLRILRPAGAGLGISIAGGDGSTPYRSNDNVCCYDFLSV